MGYYTSYYITAVEPRKTEKGIEFASISDANMLKKIDDEVSRLSLGDFYESESADGSTGNN